MRFVQVFVPEVPSVDWVFAEEGHVWLGMWCCVVLAGVGDWSFRDGCSQEGGGFTGSGCVVRDFRVVVAGADA